jgi:hypothetical protein
MLLVERELVYLNVLSLAAGICSLSPESFFDILAFQITLEQYPTSPQLTAAVILSALERGDVGPGRLVIDLGCGTGMLAIGWYDKRDFFCTRHRLVTTLFPSAP